MYRGWFYDYVLTLNGLASARVTTIRTIVYLI